MLAVPLLMRYRRELGRVVWVCGWCVVAASVAIQAASLAFWLPLEIYQIDAMGHDAWTVALRFRNIWALATGRPMPAGIDLPGALADSLGCAARAHVELYAVADAACGVAPLWVVRLLDAVWVVVAVALVCVVVRMWRLLRVEARP